MEVCELLPIQEKIISIEVGNIQQSIWFRIRNLINNTVYNISRTFKKDLLNHGFGLKSMQFIAEKYDGVITTKMVDNIFVVFIVLQNPYL